MPKREITDVKKFGRGTAIAPYKGLWERKKPRKMFLSPGQPRRQSTSVTVPQKHRNVFVPGKLQRILFSFCDDKYLQGDNM